MPYSGPALHDPVHGLIDPDPETGDLPATPCQTCNQLTLTAQVLHWRGERLVSLYCRTPGCASGATPAVPFI